MREYVHLVVHRVLHGVGTIQFVCDADVEVAVVARVGHAGQCALNHITWATVSVPGV